MANADCHEPVEELSVVMRDMHRAIASLSEELEAIDCYNQRIGTCGNMELKAILEHNRDEEKEHACILLEWIRCHDPAFSGQLEKQLFSGKPITHVEFQSMS